MSPALQQILRFASTGIATTLLHLVAAIAAIEWWAWPPVAANGVAFVLATVFAYVVNTGWSFQQTASRQNAIRYLLVVGINLLLAMLLAALTQSMGWHYGAGLAATVLALPPLSFLLHRTFTYAPARPCAQSNSPIVRTADVTAVLWLAALTLILHHSALNGYWRWDDGTHLLRATQYTWQAVFLDPEVMRTVSGNQIAPWNLFLYQLNRLFFGANVQGYYTHHLISLWLAAAAIFALLRQWLPTSRAWVAPTLLLAGMPTFQMAQQLMVGHYLYGLIFAALGLSLHIRAGRITHPFSPNAWVARLASAVLYALACLCKEIYVPWVLLWVILPLVRTPRARIPPKALLQAIKHAFPVLAVAATYTLYRLHIFQGVGGYLQGAAHITVLLQSIGDIPAALLGHGAQGILAVALLGVTLVQAARQRMVTFGVIGLLLSVVVLLPLLFVARSAPSWELHARYLWLVWLLVCVPWSFPWHGRLQHAWLPTALAFAAFIGVHVSQLRPADQQREVMFDANYRMVLQPPPGVTAWVPANINGPGYLAATAYAARQALHATQLHSAPAPALLHSPPSTESLLATIQVWHTPCNCFRALAQLTPDQRYEALQPHLTDYILPLPSQGRHPRVADQFAGPSPVLTVSGRQLHIAGATPTQGSGRLILLAGHTSVANLLPIPAAAAPPGSPQPAAQPFQATLEFTHPSAAQQAASQLCVLFQSHQQPQHFVVLQADAPNTACNRYLTPWALRQSSHAASSPTPVQRPVAELQVPHNAPINRTGAPHPQSSKNTTP